jgi:ABC-type enterochelin transport system permease subunit
MIVSFLILLPVVGIVVWAFFRFTPVHANRKVVLQFNLLSLTVALLLAIAWSVRTYLVMTPTGNTQDRHCNYRRISYKAH